MLLTTRDLQHYKIHAVDGDIGRIHECYFDDQQWRIRYLVVTTGGVLPRHRVLLPATCVSGIEEGGRGVRVTLTRDQVATSPGIDTEKPVSRQHVGELYWHYGYTGVPLPIGVQHGGDPHLRRTREVIGYVVHWGHEQVGDVDDFLVDGASWRICCMVVALAGRCIEQRVLVLPRSILGISWEAREVRVDLPWAVLRNAPRYQPGRPIAEDLEARLHDYYTHAPGLLYDRDLESSLKSGPGTRRAVA